MEYTRIFILVFLTDLGILGPVLIFLVLAIAVTGLAIGRLEQWSRFDALYHAFINATTVGYGDFRPTRKLTKGLAVANAIIGLILTGIIVATGVHAVDQAFEATVAAGAITDRAPD